MADAAKKMEMTAEVDLQENGVYIVKDGQVIRIPEPITGHGAQVIHWQGGKPCHGEMKHNLRF